MPTLHTVNRSPYRDSTLESCLRVALPGSALLLIEDGVYAAVAGGSAARLLEAVKGIDVHALGPDLEARGLAAAPLLGCVQVVGYPGFVELACRYDKVQAWF